MSDARPTRVAIVGGGCAGMAAAFDLTGPELRGSFDVTVYQLGWRLGGKGASGRGPAGRIEEHGLHLWMGFYENAFRLMRECYAELGRDPATCPIATWEDAFVAAPMIGVIDRRPDGTWIPWTATFPPTPGLPGDPYPEGRRWTVATYLTRAVGMLRALVTSLAAPEDGLGSETTPRVADDPMTLMTRLLQYGEITTLATLVQGIAVLEALLESNPLAEETALLRLLDTIAATARSQIEARAQANVAARRLWTVADLTIATIRGAIRSRLLADPRGFDAIDDYDCREWLALNGASPQSLESGYLRGLYDLGFSYEDADPSKPRISAAQALRSMVRAFFTYRGSFFWRMQAGMGDVVFAPLFEVLRRRGVRFEFFHRLENVRMALDGPSPHVAALDFDVQAEIRDGGDYEPLVEIGGLPCWPSEPDFAQLADGDRLRREGWAFESFWDTRRARARTLEVGRDFDFVVLAVGAGAIPHVCRELVDRDPRWRAMVDRVKTVATQAFQVWLGEDMEQLGWPGPAISLSGFVEPFDTWADMRHLLEREAWPHPPRALAYFCNALPDGDPAPRRGIDTDYVARQRERVRANAVRFLNHDVGHLWPRAMAAPDRFRWELLLDPTTPTPSSIGEGRFASQYWTANVNPSDRYALSLPGSSRFRISPLDRTYDNLTVAGDWTACGFNAGCVEAAVMSGRLAAHALSLCPPLDDIIGYDHP